LRFSRLHNIAKTMNQEIPQTRATQSHHAP
jgi:hypothetical protein